jgi:predicted small lipoprotein YifL
MLNRRNWVVSIIALLLVASLAACTAAPVAVPDREISIDTTTALDAQNKAMGQIMSGNLELSEEEFSSLLSVLLQQNGGANNPVDGINVWFEPDNQIVIRVNLKEGVLPANAGNTLDLAGTVSVENNHVVVDLQQAGAGNMSISGASLAPISAQINSALADPSMGVAVDVSTDTGTISVGLGGM